MVFKRLFDSKGNWLFFVLTTLFLSCHLYVRFTFHELWKDEWQSWFVVRDMNWGAMLRFLYYEGHPALWYIYLKLFTIFSATVSNAILIKGAHALLFTLFTIVVLRLKRVHFFYKAIFLLGYYPLFEYGMLSRGYILVLLGVFLLVNWMEHWRERYVPFALIVFLMCQTEIYGLLMAGCLFLYLLISDSSNWWNRPVSLFKDQQILVVGGALLLGAIAFYWTIDWAADASEVRARLVNIMSQFKGKSGLEHAFQGMFGHAILPGILPGTTRRVVTVEGFWLAVAGFGIILFLLKTHWKLLLTFYLFAGVSMYFASTTYSGGMRQWGMVYIFFVVVMFLKEQKRQGTIKQLNFIFIGVLLVHLVFGLRAVYDDVRYPFSNASAAGRYIAAEVPHHIPIVGISPFNVAAASGYAERFFYELPEGELFSYFRWLDKVYIPDEGELRLFAAYKKSNGLAVVTHQRLDQKKYPNLELVRAFDRFNLKDENFYLYALRMDP